MFRSGGPHVAAAGRVKAKSRGAVASPTTPVNKSGKHFGPPAVKSNSPRRELDAAHVLWPAGSPTRGRLNKHDRLIRNRQPDRTAEASRGTHTLHGVLTEEDFPISS